MRTFWRVSSDGCFMGHLEDLAKESLYGAALYLRLLCSFGLPHPSRLSFKHDDYARIHTIFSLPWAERAEQCQPQPTKESPFLPIQSSIARLCLLFEVPLYSISSMNCCSTNDCVLATQYIHLERKIGVSFAEIGASDCLELPSAKHWGVAKKTSEYFPCLVAP